MPPSFHSHGTPCVRRGQTKAPAPPTSQVVVHRGWGWCALVFKSQSYTSRPNSTCSSVALIAWNLLWKLINKTRRGSAKMSPKLCSSLPPFHPSIHSFPSFSPSFLKLVWRRFTSFATQGDQSVESIASEILRKAKHEETYHQPWPAKLSMETSNYFNYLTLLLGSSALLCRTFYLSPAVFYT